MTLRVKVRGRKRRRAASPWWLTGTMMAYGAMGGRVQAADAPAHLVGSSGEQAAARGEQQVFRFAIPPGSLDAVLASFRQASGLQVEAAPEVVGGINSAGVTGTYTGEQ